MSTLSHGDPEREGLGLSPLSLGRGCRRAAGEGRAPAQSLISATVRARVPRGTASRTNGTRPRPAWDSSVYQWYAPVSRVGQPHVATVRAGVRRGTAPRTNGSRSHFARDGSTSQCDAGSAWWVEGRAGKRWSAGVSPALHDSREATGTEARSRSSTPSR